MDTSALAAALARQPDVAFAYLFGSQAVGGAGPASDVDVAVLLTGGRSPQRRLHLIDELQAAVPGRLDLIVLNDAPVSLAYRVIRHGRVVHCADPHALGRFREETMRHYFDLEPLRRELERGVRDRVLDGRFG